MTSAPVDRASARRWRRRAPRRPPSAAAGAGPSSAIASTNDRNEPDSRSREPRRRGARCPRRRRTARRAGGAASSRRGGCSRQRPSPRRPAPWWRGTRGSGVVGPLLPRHRRRRFDFELGAPCTKPACLVRTVKLKWSGVDGRRLEPLRERPFARLLLSYTVNELGDAVGMVALALLVFDRTHEVAPTAGFFLIAKFLPAFFATGLTAQLDRRSLRWTLPGIYCVEAVAFAALGFLAGGGRFVLSLVLVLGFVDGTLAITGRGLTRGAVAAVLQKRNLIGEGNALMNLGFAVASVGRRRAGRRADRRARPAGGAASRRRLVPRHRRPARHELPPAASAARGARVLADQIAGRTGVRTRTPDGSRAADRPVGGADLLHDRRADRGDLRAGSLGTTSAGFGVLLSAWGAGIVLGSLLFLVAEEPLRLRR